MRYHIITTIFTFLLGGQILFGQNDVLRRDYIEKYADLAVREMKRSGIPASIKMAQALLESNNGQSELAVTANNHFGIKCHMTWSGNRFYYDDDALDECFRVYKNVEQSYEDHSLFLMSRPRYASLFDINPNDYKAWAKGLKEAGYATNPRYAELLIKIIEDNELHRLDQRLAANQRMKGRVIQSEQLASLPTAIAEKDIHTRNRINYVIATDNDNVASLTESHQLLRWEIRRYNEIPRDNDVEAGQIVYLQPKRKKAERGYDIHYAQPGDDWYSIAQHYGIKLKWLYKLNKAQPGTSVEVGQQIILR